MWSETSSTLPFLKSNPINLKKSGHTIATKNTLAENGCNLIREHTLSDTFSNTIYKHKLSLYHW